MKLQNEFGEDFERRVTMTETFFGRLPGRRAGRLSTRRDRKLSANSIAANRSPVRSTSVSASEKTDRLFVEHDKDHFWRKFNLLR